MQANFKRICRYNVGRRPTILCIPAYLEQFVYLFVEGNRAEYIACIELR